MSNFRDLLSYEIARGTLAEPFSIADIHGLIRRNVGFLAQVEPPAHFATILANFSVGPGHRKGHAVKDGLQALFRKHAGKGIYSLHPTTDDEESEIDEDDTEAETLTTSGASRRPAARKGHRAKPSSCHGSCDPIAALFVEYLRRKPFLRLETTYVRATRATQLDWGVEPVTGWWGRVQAYEWQGTNWADTKDTVAKFVQDLREAETVFHDAHAPSAQGLPGLAFDVKFIYDRIKEWGNPAGKPRSAEDVFNLLRKLWSGNPIEQVDSTLTKLYAFARPNEFVIYDSRVATAIISIAEDIFRAKYIARDRIDTVDEVFRKDYRALGLYNGRGGTRPRTFRSRTWPYAYQIPAAQLDANRLCKAIRECLNHCKEPKENGAPSSDWTLREVEAVLFMEGY